MFKRSRFDSRIEEPRDSCANCGSLRYVSDMVFDEREEHFYCDEGCFAEWASDNADKVNEYYYDMNCR